MQSYNTNYYCIIVNLKIRIDKISWKELHSREISAVSSIREARTVVSDFRPIDYIINGQAEVY